MFLREMLKETHERQLESSWIWKKIRVWSTLKGTRDYFQSTTMQEENWLEWCFWQKLLRQSNDLFKQNLLTNNLPIVSKSNHQARSSVGFDRVLWSWYSHLFDGMSNYPINPFGNTQKNEHLDSCATPTIFWLGHL